MATDAHQEPPAAAEAAEVPSTGAEDASRGPGGLLPQSPKARRRSKTEFYKPEEKAKTPLKIDQGKGSKLRDIPNAIFKISKLRADDELLTAMHTLMYKRQGTAFKRKRDILDFSGFPYADEEAKASEMAKAEDKLGKWHMGLLNKLLDCFDLPRGSGEAGQKAYKVERAVEFLMKPKILGTKNKAEMEAKRKERMKKKQESAKKKKAKVAAGKDKGPKAQKRKHGEESKPRGRPPKKAKTVPEDHEEAMDDAEGAAADSAQANELTEEVVRNELMKMLKAADLNDLSLKKVMTLLTEALGQDVKPWKPMIREVADQYAREHAEPEDEEATKAEEEEGDEKVEQEMVDEVRGQVEQNEQEREEGEEKRDEPMGVDDGQGNGVEGEEGEKEGWKEADGCERGRTNGVAV